jgi:hypothetical protein
VRRVLDHPLTPLVVLSFATSLFFVGYLLKGMTPSTSFDTLVAVGYCVLVAHAIAQDARRRRQTPCYDFNTYAYLLMPVVVPWWCFHSRGWRGIGLLASIAGLWAAPSIVAMAVWSWLYG